FDILTRNLSQATLNTYIDYDTNYLKEATTTANVPSPKKYERKSDLQFRCGPAVELVEAGGDEDFVPGHAVFFQAPLGICQEPSLVGLDRLLCGRGYFVQFSNDSFFRPPFLPPGQLRNRYRLMEFCPPAEKNLIYAGGGTPWYIGAGAPMDTDENPLNLSLNRPVADNIITLIISPRKESAETSINGSVSFNSRDVAIDPTDTQASAQGTQHLLPPMLKIVLVAIDEKSAERLSNFDENPTPPLSGPLGRFNGTVGTEGKDSDLDDAVEALKTELVGLRVNFRVFTTTVQIRGSRWSM
ncbi:MAG TPA: hypothetical protein VD994_19160, partial [Prosthecobacter sp.]|nr:hypothetical protein [Prosthecobacter sp.]